MTAPPDKLSLWPLEAGTFGIDATFQGVSGYENAGGHECLLREAGIAYQLRQELGDAWTLRLGPVARDDVLTAIEAFLEPGRRALAA